MKIPSANGSVCSDLTGLCCWPCSKHGQGSIPVFCPGGKGKDKAWIITLPDNAGFNEVPEENVSKVLTYLTSVPRYDLSISFGLWWAEVWILPG